MERQLTGEKPHFRPEKRSLNPYRIIILLGLIMGGIWILMGIDRGDVQPLFLPTPTPTRTANSFIMEGEAQFKAGSLGGAIAAYQQAVAVEPNNAHAWAELARIQTYSSSLLSTDEERYERLTQARESIEQATSIDPDNSEAQAVRSFVFDWYASNPLVSPQESQSALNDAESAAIRALQLDNENALALAFLAEILVDQQKWAQAEETIKQAVAIQPESMDVQRVYGYVLESLGQYRLAIEKYREAVNIQPNLTFLYIFIGRNFRSLEVHNRALEEFEKAVMINEQLGVQDPVPYVEIAKTYSRDGEFFIAALNAEKAITINPYNPNTYGQLGIIYTKARNFEGAQPVLKCAVRGCTAEENQVALELLGEGVSVEGMPLTSGTVAFYYAQYGSVLAALSRPNQNFCPEALQVLSEVRTAYPEDPTFNQIIDENIAICELVDQRSAPQPSPTLSPSP
ncbi:MAG: tetratricopeptide repeat protein [Anaerolineales bacterium]